MLRVYSARSWSTITPKIHIKASPGRPPPPSAKGRRESCTQVCLSLAWIHVPADVISLSHSCVSLQGAPHPPTPTKRPPRAPVAHIQTHKYADDVWGRSTLPLMWRRSNYCPPPVSWPPRSQRWGFQPARQQAAPHSSSLGGGGGGERGSAGLAWTRPGWRR